jgi:photosystem II stability/assembly factor-like uncharacterized protein
MATSSKEKGVNVLIGTRKGAFIFSGNRERTKWDMSEILFKSWTVMDMVFDPRDGRLHASVAHDVYGPTTQYSDDLGQTWNQSARVPQFTRPSKSGRPLGTPQEVLDEETAIQKPEEVIKTWKIKPASENQPGVLYAGVEPGSLFISRDQGETWQINESLYDHPHRKDWFPGAGGQALHSILPHPTDPNRLHVAISTGGTYRTDDGGKTWTAKNKNVRADFFPEKFPEFGQCVHSLAMHPAAPERIYQQNHCGMYRSDNAGDDWIDIGEGKLPSRFGFPIAVHPYDPQTIFVVPEESDEYRLSLDGRFAVWRSRDAGQNWEMLTRGLPERSYLVVLRQAMAVDDQTDAGIYVGTSTGELFYSVDNGDSWALMAAYLPKILSVNTAVFNLLMV